MFELCEGIRNQSNMMDGNNVSSVIKIMAQDPLKAKDYKETKNKGTTQADRLKDKTPAYAAGFPMP